MFYKALILVLLAGSVFAAQSPQGIAAVQSTSIMNSTLGKTVGMILLVVFLILAYKVASGFLAKAWVGYFPDSISKEPKSLAEVGPTSWFSDVVGALRYRL